MKYSIEGDYPILRCALNRGETIKTSAGAMSWMTDGFDIETASGGIMKGIARMFSGESMVFNLYTAKPDNQEIVFASSSTSRVNPIPNIQSMTNHLRHYSILRMPASSIA